MGNKDDIVFKLLLDFLKKKKDLNDENKEKQIIIYNEMKNLNLILNFNCFKIT